MVLEVDEAGVLEPVEDGLCGGLFRGRLAGEKRRKVNELIGQSTSFTMSI